MSLDLRGSRNYAAQVIRVPRLVTLNGLDNLVGIPALGGQALVSKDEWQTGDLALAFGPETQLSEDYVAWNNLYRHQELNRHPGKAGYLESNRRVRAIRLRGHESNVLLMPLSSLDCYPPSKPQEGDSFDHIGDSKLCQKYVVPVKEGTRGASKVEKAFKRVEEAVFPKHLETDQFARNVHTVPFGKHIIVTQKLHGTSARIGLVPVKRELSWFERTLLWLRIAELE